MEATLFCIAVPEQERQNLLMLLFSGREEEATQFRDARDTHWAEHLDDWETARLPLHAPQTF